jgi:hypothetical protein
MEISRHRKKLFAVGALLALAFLFRLAFGLSSDFWNEDETDLFDRPQVLHNRNVALFRAGCDQHDSDTGRVAGLDGRTAVLCAAVPEAPYVLLNLLSFTSLCFRVVLRAAFAGTAEVVCVGVALDRAVDALSFDACFQSVVCARGRHTVFCRRD